MNPSDPSSTPQKTGLSRAGLAGIVGGIVIVLVAVGVAMALLGMVPIHLESVKTSVSYEPNKPAKASATLKVDGPDGTTVTSSDPEQTLPPKWVPAYPAAQGQAGGTRREGKDTVSGTYLAFTQDDPDKVKDYYESTLKADGFETAVTTTTTEGTRIHSGHGDDGEPEAQGHHQGEQREGADESRKSPTTAPNRSFVLAATPLWFRG